MNSNAGTTAVVGISGGVDSAVAALMLRDQGFDVQGLHMSNWDDDEEYCTAAADFQSARDVASDIGIPLHRARFAREYKNRVFEHFLETYARGLTPNPDVLCNREIKFGVFRDYARRLGADVIATGHYAQLGLEEERVALLRGADPDKDQSYFLHAVDEAAFDNVLFPIGGCNKSEVRDFAARRGLPNYQRPDSTGICFIGERPFREFLGRFLPARPGPLVTDSGECIGEHRGVMYYTIGQRQGLGIGGVRGSDGSAWYVVAKDPATRTLTVVQGRDHPSLWRRELTASDVSWVSTSPFERQTASPVRLTAKTRYRQPDAACNAEQLDDGRVRIRFDEMQWAIAPGQYVVLYEGNRCLGGGTIDPL